MVIPLERLFGSRTRAKLLVLFTGGVRRPYYVRELSRLVSERVNSIRREVENLRRIGLLQTHLRAGKKFYTVNPTFPLLEELSKLAAKGGKSVTDQLFEGVRRIGHVRLVLLTGFFVQAKHAPTDILIVGDLKPVPFRQFIDTVQEELGRDINFTVMSVEEYDYRRKMNDHFLAEILRTHPVELVNTFVQQSPVSSAR
ncbi:MAG: hypothetical protein G01um1014106_56 [Parcubacteria group bacterium Gr01-1014_106]|nr:MAG: hypothetical protein G01um1014106_56 [Parcubacteria group bacterium Gr01-1014_106]